MALVAAVEEVADIEKDRKNRSFFMTGVLRVFLECFVLK